MEKYFLEQLYSIGHLLSNIVAKFLLNMSLKFSNFEYLYETRVVNELQVKLHTWFVALIIVQEPSIIGISVGECSHSYLDCRKCCRRK